MDIFSSLPNVYLIGAAKSGTSTLYHTLNKHPEITYTKIKEPFFWNDDEMYEKGVEWYIDQYLQGAENYPIRIDGSTRYLYWGDKVTQRLKTVYGDQPLKFIAVFRDPVKRAHSFYWHSLYHEAEFRPLAEAIRDEEVTLEKEWSRLEKKGLMAFGYFRGGCYASMLQPYLERFPREQFLFLLMEDLIHNFDDTLNQVQSFLGVSSFQKFEPLIANKTKATRHLKLLRWVKNPSGLKNLLKIVIPTKTRKLMKKKFRSAVKQGEYPPIPPELERELRGRYTEEIQRLEGILDRDLSHWYSASS
jgi:hypothetical protein